MTVNGVFKGVRMRLMTRFLFAVLALGAPAAAELAAQDYIRFRNPKEADMECEVKSASSKTVEFDIFTGDIRAAQTRPARDIREIVLHANHKTYDFNAGESSMNNDDYAPAIERFERVKKDSRASDLLKQMASINIIKCHYLSKNAPNTLAAIKAFRQEKPDSFYLLDTHRYEFLCHFDKNDVASATQSITSLQERAKADGNLEWAKIGDTMQANLNEMQKRWRDALAIYRKYLNDSVLSEDALLGELRCLRELGDWPGLRGKADATLVVLKGRKGVSDRVLTGAYNARAESNLNAGNLREAILDFMQGVAVFNKEMSPEHEISLGHGAVACARFAAAQKEKQKKDTYKQRAQELLSELERRYPGSALRAEVQKAIQEVK